MLLLNKARLRITISDLPCLIHGMEGSGTSLFSVSVLSELYTQGAKVLFFSAKHAARETFLLQIDRQDEFIIKSGEARSAPTDNQALFVESGNEQAFIETTQQLPDINDRVIFIKNIENYDKTLLEAITDKKKVIITGDIDRSSIKDLLMQKDYITKIFFTPTAGVTLPPLEKYTGYLLGEHEKGVVIVIGTNVVY